MTARLVVTAVIAGALGLGLGLPATAHADRADQLFRKGKKLLAEKRYAEACAAFEDSDRIDPQIGAKLNVARCYEEWGKLATAWRWFSEAEQLAIKAGDDRAKKIHALLAELDPKVPRLALRVPTGAEVDRATIELDGVALHAPELGVDRRIDAGRHRVDVVIEGARRSRMVEVERGSIEVVLDLPVREPAPRVTRSAAPAAASAGELRPDDGGSRRLLGLGVAGAGGAAIVVGVIVTLRAHSDYEHALDGYCHGATDMCDDTGLARTHSARHRANIATGVSLAGLAAIAGGVVLYLTAPAAERRERSAHALYVAPALGGDAAGVVLGGAF